LRKLSADDRLAGALLFILEQGLRPGAIALGLAAGLLFDPSEDPSSQEMQSRLQQEGPDAFLSAHSGLSGSEKLDEWRATILLLRQALTAGRAAREE
jgi:hypothetical protein